MTNNSSNIFVSNDITPVCRNRNTLLLVCLDRITGISAQSACDSADIFGAKDIAIAFRAAVCHQAVITIADDSSDILSL